MGQLFCYKVGQVLQSETDVVTKWDRCYKVRRILLQSGTGVTKCKDCYKVGSNKGSAFSSIHRPLTGTMVKQ